jgi:Ca-activated chloride channel family protein
VIKRLVLLSLLGAIFTAITISGQQQSDIDDQSSQTPSFRSGVDIVTLNVTVTDANDRFVTDLTSDNFVVYEDGVSQKLSFFNHNQIPIALALLIDTSASMDERMTTAQEAAIGFSQRLKPEDLAEIIDFDSRVKILQTFTNNVDLLEKAIRQTSAGTESGSS